MENNRTKYTKLLIAAIFGAIFLVPFVIMVMGAFVNFKLPVGNPFTWGSRYGFSTVNFSYIFRHSPFLLWVKNSIIISVLPTVSQMFFAAILGYIFAKKDFKYKNVIFWLMMSVIMIPTQVLIIPRYILFGKMNLLNKRSVLILPVLWSIMGVFLVRQFMQQLPSSLEESARIDGAGDFRIFFSIMLPLSKPVVATVGTFAFITAWNDFLTPLIFTTSKNLYPITVGLATLLTNEGHFGIEMAGAFLSFIPTFIIFLFFQKYFTKGIAFTGIK